MKQEAVDRQRLQDKFNEEELNSKLKKMEKKKALRKVMDIDYANKRDHTQ